MFSFLTQRRSRTERKIDALTATCARIEQTVKQLLQKETIEMKTIEDIQASVAAQKTVIGSAVTLLGHLSDLLKAAQGDPAKIQQIITDLDGNTSDLAAAVTANTPAAA